MRNSLCFLKLLPYYGKTFCIRKFTEAILPPLQNSFLIHLIYSHDFKNQLDKKHFQIYIIGQTFLLDLRSTVSSSLEIAASLILKSFGHCALNMSHSYPCTFFSCQICFLYYIPYTGNNSNINPLVHAKILRMNLICPSLTLSRLIHSSLKISLKSISSFTSLPSLFHSKHSILFLEVVQ